MKHTKGKAELRKRLLNLSKKFTDERGDIRYRERIFIEIASGNYIEVVSLNKKEVRANAEHVVKIWNSHDKLTSVLQLIIKESKDPRSETLPPIFKRLFKIAEQELKNAE